MSSFCFVFFVACCCHDDAWLIISLIFVQTCLILSVLLSLLALSGSPSGLKVFTGNANKALAQDIANHLG